MATDVRAKLAEKGLTLPVSSKPIAAYVPAVRTGNIVFTASHSRSGFSGSSAVRTRAISKRQNRPNNFLPKIAKDERK